MSDLPINTALFVYLTGKATITDSVSDSNRTAARADLIEQIGERMYSEEAPQAKGIIEGDFLYFSKTAATAETNMEGNAGLGFTTFNIGGESKTAEGRERLSQNVFRSLHGFFGNVEYGNDSLQFQMVKCDSADENYVIEAEGSDDLIYGFTRTCEIAHEV